MKARTSEVSSETTQVTHLTDCGSLQLVKLQPGTAVSECDDQTTTADNWQYIIQYVKDVIINFYNIYSVGRFHPSM